MVERSRAYALDPDAGERLVFGGATILIRASAETTGGAYTSSRRCHPWWTRRCTSTRTRTSCSLTSPAGLEGFFRMLAESQRAGTLGPSAYAEASATYGITWLQ